MSEIAPFVHLHNHTEYSFLDGAIRISDLVKRARKFNMPALAITDHGGMFGAMEFYNTCMKEGIKPVIGFEAYVAPRTRFEKAGKGDDFNYNHLILLAKDKEGYKNLLKLSSTGYIDGFYYKPRIDLDILRECSKGIIATSACVAGEIPRTILKKGYAEAKLVAEKYLQIFGEGNFYFELQNHGIDDELVAFDELIKLGKEMGVPFVLTNDAHYLDHADAASHEVLLCIQTQTTLSDPKHYRFSSDQIYFKSPQEMSRLFPDIPEAMSNTLTIAERCNVMLHEKPLLPVLEVPSEFPTQDDYLKDLARKGLYDRYPHVTPGLEERLAYELDVVCKMGFAGYFLIVRDFVLAAKNMGIMVGCRGSAAGSLAAYCVEITSVDPIKFDLIFERFLNPERISMPDADIDFADRDRHRVIEYVINKYGREAVCQIINFGRMKAKMVIKDVARVMGIPVAESQRLSDMIDAKSKSLGDAISSNGELKRAIEANPAYGEIFRHGKVLEGLARQAGMHAGGVIIAPGPVVNWAPLYRHDSDIMTQYDMKTVEDAGLIKMDFLGLSTLSVQQEALRLIEREHGTVIDVWKLADHDAKTYELFGRGDTIGIFQFESQGMQDYLRKLKPTNVEDLIAMNALYRPGPMENIDVYIHRKHGTEKVEYLHPMLKDVLDVTYGVIIYQEQVMRIAQMMGGFTLGQADTVRKAMSKKQGDKMDELGKKFVAGAQKLGIETKVANDVYDLMAKFAEYGFNKAHATVYAHVAYQSGYLKSHYPIEYMTAAMTVYVEDQDYFLAIKNESQRMGVAIMPPDVNKSEKNCTIEDGKIRLGLIAIKNVSKAADVILSARREKGAFSSIFDMCSRVDLSSVNKKAMESLACAGAFDSLKGTRAQLFAAIDRAMEYGAMFQKDRMLGQTNLFGDNGGGGGAVSIPEPQLPMVLPWPYNELLQKEKEVINFYASGHPLDAYQDEIFGFTTLRLSPGSFENIKDGDKKTVGGLVTSLKTHTQRDGKIMAFIEIEDFDGSIELLVFGDAYEKFRHLLAPDAKVLVHGQILMKEDQDKPKLRVDNVMDLAEAREKLTRAVHIRVQTQGLEEAFVREIFSQCSLSKGECGLVIHLKTHKDNEYRVRSRLVKMSADSVIIDNLRSRLGKENVWLSKTAA